MARFQKGFQTQHDEINVGELPIRGKVPDWLSGTLLRNTPAQFEVGDQSFRHWFDGLAMLHAFTFENGRVGYANRYLRSPAYNDDNAEGRIVHDEYATDPCRSLFGRIFSYFTTFDSGGNANVNVTRLGEKYIARTEYPTSIIFDPETLETLGVEKHPGMEGQITTAHPHRDAQRDAMYNYRLHLGFDTSYRLYELTGDQDPECLFELPVDRPAYTHSFGMSDSYLILAEIPLKSPGALDFLLGNEPYADKFRWVPEEGTRIIVVDKDTGEVAAQKMTEPFFAFHHVNAFERDGEVVMDISAYEDASIIDELYLDNLRGEDAGVSVESRLRRYRIPLGPSGKVTSEQISDTSFELPGYDYQRYAGQPYSVVWGSGTGEGSGGFHNQLVKIHTDTGETKTWHEENMYPSEPVFVRAPGASGEEDGVLLSVVLDGDRGDSFLLILEPATMEERARARLPQHVPFGFHGQYFDNVSA